MKRTCQFLVPTGKARSEACGQVAVEHTLIYSHSEWDDDDVHCYSCEEHKGRFTPSDYTKVFVIDG